jgi:DGQHR domain-containing protein
MLCWLRLPGGSGLAVAEIGVTIFGPGQKTRGMDFTILMSSARALATNSQQEYSMTVNLNCFSSAEGRGPHAELRLPALEIRQNEERILYSFAVDGKQLHSFAAVSRLQDGDLGGGGYQRPEVLSHVASIRRYLESGSPMIPSALVIAFDKRVRFVPLADAQAASYVRHGTLVIPTPGDATEGSRPGWIMDGQQRSAAIRDARINCFPVVVTAFISESEEVERSQFILVNSAKPLPKGLIYELLPATSGTLPVRRQARKFPAALLRQLNYEPRSPLYQRICTATTPAGIVKDDSILKMLEHSLSDGALYSFRDLQTGTRDQQKMMDLLTAFWAAVRNVFADAWDKPPRQSRLMHGVGIVSLGFIMDTIYDRYSRERTPSENDFARDLAELRDVCNWTSGFWDFGPGSQRKWNELQNTTRDIQLLTNFLLWQYKARVWGKPLIDQEP